MFEDPVIVDWKPPFSMNTSDMYKYSDSDYLIVSVGIKDKIEYFISIIKTSNVIVPKRLTYLGEFLRF